MDDAPNERKSSALRMIGKVIKGGEGNEPLSEKPILPPPRRAGVLNAEEFEAKGKAKEIIAAAEAEAEKIRAMAREHKEKVFAEAREEAKADVAARASEELARAKLQAGQIIAETEAQVVDLALKVASKIIGRELERDPDVLLEIVATAAEAARAAKAMTFRVHPEDGRILREKRPRLMELISRSVDINVKDDPDVEKGGCVIQTEFGTIDGQIRTQLSVLQNLFTPAEGRKEVK